MFQNVLSVKEIRSEKALVQGFYIGIIRPLEIRQSVNTIDSHLAKVAAKNSLKGQTDRIPTRYVFRILNYIILMRCADNRMRVQVMKKC